LGLLAGLAAGAVLGILFAPEKGTETRRKIAEKGEDYVDEIKKMMNEQTKLLKSILEKSGK